MAKWVRPKFRAITGIYGYIVKISGWLLISTTAMASDYYDLDFSIWLDSLKQEARQSGISETTIFRALGKIDVQPPVLTKAKSQPEKTETLECYVSKRVTPRKIREGQEIMSRNVDFFGKLENEYGVPPSILVAIWGLETDYGRNKGTTDLVNSLATLAFYSHRSAFFKKELLATLSIMDHNPSLRLIGSWAGAFGHMQFMPTTFKAYAKDGDADGIIDIVDNPVDALESGANYLKKAGWHNTGGSGLVLVKAYKPGNSPKAMVSLTQWGSQGLHFLNGPQLKGAILGKPLAIASRPLSNFLVTPNFQTILRWNNSTKYAISVVLLAKMLDENESAASLLKNWACSK